MGEILIDLISSVFIGQDVISRWLCGDASLVRM